jgi:hypothetical protein
MATRRADLFLLALLDLHGIIPTEVALAVADLYSEPSPVNYETAVARVHEKIHELIEAGTFGAAEEDGESEPGNLLPITPHVRNASSDSRLPVEPPAWFLGAWESWNHLREFEAEHGI